MYYSVGGYPRAYLRDKAKISFTVAKVDTNATTVDTTYRLDMWPYGSKANTPTPSSVVQLDWQQNHYLAHCGSHGIVGVLGYQRVIYEDIFTKIDMHFYSGSKGQKMSFVLKPGCDPDDLRLAFEGQDSMGVDLWGNLKMYYNGSWMVLPFVQAYQVNGSGAVVPVSWEANYEVDNGVGTLGFTWSDYNSAWPLVFQIGIPPFGPASSDEEGLCWGTYLGGGERDDVYESVEDENGNYYVVGTTGSTYLSFPESPGTSYSMAGTAAYIVKFNLTDNIVWKTFFGGNALGETTRGTAIGHKEDGEVYMAGHSDSEELAVYQPPVGSEFYQGSATGPDYKGYIVRLKKLNGTREWATYYGQNDVYINGMVGLDGKKIYIVGSTQSTIPDLDVTPPVGSTYWPYSAETDGFVSLFADNDQHAWRTQIPGTANDPAYDVDAAAGRLVVMGNTHSEDIELVPSGANSFSQGPFGGEDCYLYEFDEDGAVRWSSYVGSIGYEQSWHNGVAIDPVTKDIALVGSGSFDLDVVEGSGWYQDAYPPGASPGFIARFSGTDRSRTWHSYLHNGSGSVVYPTVCSFDPTGKLLVSAYVRNGDGTLLRSLSGLYEQDQFNADFNGASIEQKDPIVLAFGTSNEHLYGSYFGGEAHPTYPENIYALLHRRWNGNIYLGGITSRANNTTSYFPLDDGGGVPYFEDEWHGGLHEGFLAAICAEALNEVGLDESRSRERTVLSAHWSEAGLTVFGLPPGPHPIHVVDAAGRLVFSHTARSNGSSLIAELPALAAGSYVLNTASYTARFVVIR